MLRRYAMEDSSGLSYFTWDQNGMNLLAERDASGGTIAYYTHGYTPIDGIGSLAAAKREEAGTSYYQYPIYDAIKGNVVRLVDENGTPTAYYEYDAWGNELRDDVVGGTAKNRFRYQSNWIELTDDPDNVLKLTPTRLYHAGVGRFLGRDRFERTGLAGGYDYVRNASTGSMDPTGLIIVTSCDVRDKLLNSGKFPHLRSDRSYFSAVKGFGVVTHPNEIALTYAVPTPLRLRTGADDLGIVEAMLRSERVFRVKTWDDLRAHVRTRQHVVSRARSARMGFALDTGAQFNTDFWEWAKNSKDWRVRGNSAYEALTDMWKKSPVSHGTLYSLPCLPATWLVYITAIGDFAYEAKAGPVFERAVGKIPLRASGLTIVDSGVPSDDWVPGDWGYIANNNPPEVPLKVKRANYRRYYFPGQEGENIVYLGNDRYWGHGGGILPLRRWIEKISMWFGPTQTAYRHIARPTPGVLLDYRRYPLQGLVPPYRFGQ
jgi:RHS repeat-associated protein